MEARDRTNQFLYCPRDGDLPIWAGWPHRVSRLSTVSIAVAEAECAEFRVGRATTVTP